MLSGVLIALALASALVSSSTTFTQVQEKSFGEERISQRSSTPLIGPKEGLKIITDDFANDPVYLAQIAELSKTYEYIRRMIPDGNCFYRAFSYGTLENILSKNDQILAFREKIVKSKEKVSEAGFTQSAIEDSYNKYLEVIDKVQLGMTADQLETLFQEENLSDHLVLYLRFITSAEMRSKSDIYSNFMTDMTVEEFCVQEVESMGREADHIQIVAITSALDAGVGIYYMDRGVGAFHMFPENVATSTISLIYIPGHYDLIYKKEEQTVN